MAAQRITSKKPHRLIQDNDCHWYIIPYDVIDEFWTWVGWQENYCEPSYEGLDFNQFRINGPHTLKIYSWGED